ncbi:MAG: GNAT family N-acetyltransferase [Chitinophagaceae bacterium]|nr:GNAT family N-acetyltransferase [Chitinophagaceae bacterium]
MIVHFQPILQNNLILMQPLTESDFEALFKVASDPLIWEQHPNKNRYQREVFQNYFEGALQSKGAMLILDKATGEVAGCSRFYDYHESDASVFIGYTFFGRKFWGKQYNPASKQLMLDYAFQLVNTVKFHIGAKNIRSQIAIERVGAVKTKEVIIAYHGEPDRENFEYELKRENRTNTIKDQVNL